MIPKLKEAIKSFTLNGFVFNIKDLKEELDQLYKKSDKYHPPVSPMQVKKAAINLFERGFMVGYCIKTRPMIGNKGPYHIIEFSPDNIMKNTDIIPTPDPSKNLVCHLTPEQKSELIELSRKLGCSQDALARTMISKCLNSLKDAMK